MQEQLGECCAPRPEPCNPVVAVAIESTRHAQQRQADHENLRSRPRRLARRLVLAQGLRPARSQGPQGVHADANRARRGQPPDGRGERSHLMRAGIDISTHATDVVNLMKWERLSGVVLCGHSYGGMVISLVAEQMAEKIASIVFLDAFVPENGDTMEALTSDAVRETLKAAAARGDLGVPQRSAAAFLVNQKDQAWVDSLTGPQPIGTMT